MKLLGGWRNLDTQVAFIECSLQLQDPDLINFEHTPRRQARIDTIQGAKSSSYVTTWCSIDLIERLVELSDSRYYMRVRELFEIPIKSCPEYLVIALAQTQPQGGNFLLDELYGVLLPLFLGNHVNSILVLEKLWSINPRLVMKAICNLYRYDPNLMNLSRVLDITQEIKELLKSILVLDCYDFTIPLAILAGKRDFLHFDHWMTDRIKSVGEPFVVSLIAYLEDCIMRKTKDQATHDPPDKRLEKSYLSPEKLAVIFENLKKYKNLPDALMQQIENIHKEAVSLFPTLVTPSNESLEIEDEANRWFQKVFIGEISVADLINLMKTYKESKDPKQNEIYACMIHNLLDEYKFFYKYPEKELKITGQLFGSIIQHKVVDAILEKISLKYAFEALKRTGKMLRFGAYALEQFLDRLQEWPNSIELILKMTNFKNTYPELYKKVQEIGQRVVKQPQKSVEPRMSPPIETIMPTTFVPTMPTTTVPPRANYPLVQSSPPPPNYAGPYRVQTQPPPGTVPYFLRREAPMMGPGFSGAQRSSPGYPVTPEVGTRPPGYPNFIPSENREYAKYHGIPQNPPISYLPTVLDNTPKPIEEVVQPSKKIVDTLSLYMNMMNEMEYLKAKDAALKCIEADVNTIPWLAHTIVDRATTQFNNHVLFFKFISATQSRSLANTVLAETAGKIKRILELNKGNDEPDEKSKKAMKNLAAFMGIITIGDNKPILAKDLDLKEILIEGYNTGGITLPLVLICQILRRAQNSKVFKPNNPWMRAIFSLLVDLSQIPSVMSNFGSQNEISLLYETLGIPKDYYPPAKIITPKPTPPPQVVKPAPIYHPRPTVPIGIGNVVPPMRPPYGQPAFRGASPQPQISGIVINSEISKVLQELDPNYIGHIKKAIDSSVLGILKPVIERSVTIALITTREIVLKDFALDPNGNKLLEAANQMVQCLAGSLAMVTCREPLRMSMSNQLKEVLKKYELPQKELEQIVKAISNENLDIGSTYIQKSVIGKARQRVSEDTAIREALEMRAPKNQIVLTYNTPKQLPEALRPKKEGLSSAELDVYKELNRVLKENTTSFITDLVMQGDVEPKGKYKITDSLQALHTIIMEGEGYAHPEAVARIKQDMQEIERIPKMLDQVSREVFQHYVKLITNEEKVTKEKGRIYLQLLILLADYYKYLPSLITDLLMKNSPEEIKYNYDIVSGLFQNSLINIGIYDRELSLALHHIEKMAPTSADNLITFVSLLVLNLVLSEKILQPAQLTSSFMELNSIQKTPKALENVAFMSMLSNLSSNDKNPKQAASQLFEEWVTLNQDQSQEQLQSYFVKLTLHLSSDERFLTFFSVALDAAIEQALFSTISTQANDNVLVPNYPDRLNFRLIDSILKLLFTLLPYKLQMCTKYFSNFMRALAGSMKAEHSSRPLEFNQRPYYRFFIIILQSLKKPEFKMLPHNEMLQYIALALHEVAPRHCPAFTFAWLDLVSHRNFMPDLLRLKNDDKYFVGKFVVLLCEMYEFLRFLIPPNEQFNSPNLVLYLQAVVRITLVLGHDFQDFLVQHYFELLLRLPEQCVQLRNIILSACPSNVKLPNPTSGIHFDHLPEEKTPPSIMFDYKQILGFRGIKEDIDKYMVTGAQSLLVDVCNKLISLDSVTRTKRPGTEVFHAIVLYLAEIGIVYDPPKKELTITSTLLNIISKLDLQAREQLINAMFNEIRYPNSYTQYFIMFLLHTIENGKPALIQEQVMRILLERVTAHSPVPWGITAFFLEVVQNPKYDITNKPFVKGYKEIEALIAANQNVD